jgi:hypothetical protein
MALDEARQDNCTAAIEYFLLPAQPWQLRTAPGPFDELTIKAHSSVGDSAQRPLPPLARFHGYEATDIGQQH